MAVSDIDIFGRKTFFIACDSTIASTDKLEELCARGYEAYSISADGDVRRKIEAIIRLYPDSIIFVNAAAKTGSVNWRALIKDVSMAHRKDVLFGVVHSGTPEANSDWNDLNLAAGVVALGDGGGFASLLDALKKAGAKGRRAYVRVNCDAGSTVSMKINGRNVTAKVEDINLSHFRCTFSEEIEAKIFDKVRDAKMTVNGFSFTANAVLIMKRNKLGVHNYILMFIHGEDDLPDLDEKLLPQLNRMIYRTVSSIRMSALNDEIRKG